jgi:hypothetical protein
VFQQFDYGSLFSSQFASFHVDEPWGAYQQRVQLMYHERTTSHQERCCPPIPLPPQLCPLMNKEDLVCCMTIIRTLYPDFIRFSHNTHADVTRHQWFRDM